MIEQSSHAVIPLLDAKEQMLIYEIRKEGGDIFREDLRSRVKGSNTTFIRKLMSLEKKGLIEAYKKEDGRVKTAYRFTPHAKHLFNIADALGMEKWFSASQKIELFPEFGPITQPLTGKDIDVYNMLGIEPQRLSLETHLAASESPSVKTEETGELLSMCSAFLQNIVTGRLHPRFEQRVEGYIIFHYILEKPQEEVQRLLPECIINYVTATEPIDQHKASSRLLELVIKYSEVLPMLTMTALNIAKTLTLEEQEKELLENYKAYKEGEEPKHVNRIRVTLSVLEIFKALYRQRPEADRNPAA